MKNFMRSIMEMLIRSLRIFRSYGSKYLLKRIVKYLNRHGWRSILFAGNLNSQYQKWLAKKKVVLAGLQECDYNESITIVMPMYNPNLSQFQEAMKSVLQQNCHNWKMCIVDDGSEDSGALNYLKQVAANDKRVRFEVHHTNEGISASTNTGVSMADTEYVLFMDQDDILRPHAISAFLGALSQNKELDLMYGDEDKIDENGTRRTDPFFKPEWSPHLLHSFNYIGHPLVVRKNLVQQLGGLRSSCDGAQDHDLLLRLSELPINAKRIPDILYSWRISAGSTADGWEAKPLAAKAGFKAIEDALKRKGYEGTIMLSSKTGTYVVRIGINKRCKISVIIPTKNNYSLLRRCIESIQNRTTYDNYEVVIIDNGSSDQEVLTYLDLLEKMKNFKILKYPGDFNYPLINNFAAGYASGEHVVFLNDDTEVISGDWLEALLEYSQMPEVGAVGGLLLFPDGLIQHAGIVVGMRGSASHAFYKCDGRSPGYFNLVDAVRDVSAVTAACMMIKSTLFAKVGGFNPDFRLGLNDVDICLRLIKLGLYNIYTPYCRLIHYESATRGEYVDDSEIQLFKQLHHDCVLNGDPYYHPELSLERNDFTLAV